MQDGELSFTDVLKMNTDLNFSCHSQVLCVFQYHAQNLSPVLEQGDLSKSEKNKKTKTKTYSVAKEGLHLTNLG